ncbi:TPA: SNF2-related protein [Clostridioides difficile]|uniref:DEAD/DEAH box helicase n=1 Tax=Clostridioides difficile TaxID=1496 RepID=UPI001C16DAA1|nr:DEAD/DEAH box helicase [Clostridioides difficile]MBY1383098.1 DEAD/DEAH box helicase [Clostridioides difficile]MCR1683221.1 DEAD/DEAH box helicase [Clostridioides difficile]GMK81730.1 DEAD/DEAH box helicase [Clostridioides difficile]HBE8439560.1 DEAD/DEAH box helicase [Clostridioides difficile]HBF8574924.1 DEAD/DEAH box helicase [Clostridioides difficile]
MEFKPHPYQEYTIRKTIDNNNIGLLLDMGLGKTVCTLTAISELMYDYFDISKVLVIAPLRVARDTWSSEVKKWEHLKHLKVSKVLGSKLDRVRALSTDSDIYIINREMVPWIVDFYKSKWPFDMVVIDELSSFKSNKAQRFKSLKKVLPLTKRVVGLTGTPAPNSLIDLWPQMYLLDRGERLGKTITGYKERYFEPGQKNYQTGAIYNWQPKDGAEKAIHNKIKDICISLKAEDYLNMPRKIDNKIEIHLDSKTLKYYKELEKEKILELDKDIITASSAAVVANKLLQLANGAIYDNDKKVKEFHREKLEALKEIIDISNGKPIIVFYNYKHDYSRLMKEFKTLKPRTIENSKDIYDWNNGKIQLLLCHPASTGHGLNLQSGGSIIVWFGLTWSLELYQQANARLYRQGQRETVIIHHLICKGTIDEQVMEALENKDKGQSALLEAVKVKLKEYRE